MFLLCSSGQEIEDGHSDGHAIFDLVEDDRLFAVGRVAVEFDAPVDGAGVHDDDVLAEAVEEAFIDAVGEAVFAQGGEERLVLALELDAKDVGDVAPFEGVAEVIFHADVEGFADMDGYECWGTCDGHFGAHFL